MVVATNRAIAIFFGKWTQDTLCKHLWNTASPTPLRSKPPPKLRLKVFRFSSRPHSWHRKQKNIVVTVWWFQMFVSCVLKTSLETRNTCHTLKMCIAFVTFSVTSMWPRHVTTCQWKQQNCCPASIHDVSIEWFEIHRYRFLQPFGFDENELIY